MEKKRPGGINWRVSDKERQRLHDLCWGHRTTLPKMLGRSVALYENAMRLADAKTSEAQSQILDKPLEQLIESALDHYVKLYSVPESEQEQVSCSKCGHLYPIEDNGLVPNMEHLIDGNKCVVLSVQESYLEVFSQLREILRRASSRVRSLFIEQVDLTARMTEAIERRRGGHENAEGDLEKVG